MYCFGQSWYLIEICDRFWDAKDCKNKKSVRKGAAVAKRKVAYRKRSQNKFSMFLVTVVVLMVLIVVTVRNSQIREKVDSYNVRLEQLNTQIEKEQARTQEIEEYGKYTQTKKFVEEVAKEKLGLVYENEIIYKQE